MSAYHPTAQQIRNIRAYKIVILNALCEMQAATIHDVRDKLIDENRIVKTAQLGQLRAAVDQLVKEGKIKKHGKTLSPTS